MNSFICNDIRGPIKYSKTFQLKLFYLKTIWYDWYENKTNENILFEKIISENDTAINKLFESMIRVKYFLFYLLYILFGQNKKNIYIVDYAK